MDKQTLSKAVSDVRESWEAAIADLGPEGLERPGATDAWRVRDVLAHLNGWDRWQLVQLRCAFSGETPTDHELTGGVEFPPNDSFTEDAMNEMFRAGNQARPLADVLADWRELNATRAGWVAAASQDQLDALIGFDHASGEPRVCRLVSEVPSIPQQKPASDVIVSQVGHHGLHLRIVHEWMRTS